MESSTADEVQVFEQLGALERDFAEAELVSLRQKEQALAPLYLKRQTLLSRIPQFWPTVLRNAPESILPAFTLTDLSILSHLTNLTITRPDIISAEKGDPRSLRFVFTFAPNDIFSDTQLVKEYKYHADREPHQNPTSVPVPIKWKSKRVDPTHGVLDLAIDLYKAEQAFKASSDKKGQEIELDPQEREALWQYEKLLGKLDELNEEQHSFFNWFGYRGWVGPMPQKGQTNGKPGEMAKQNKSASEDKVNGGDDAEDDWEDEEGDEDAALDVEIFPDGDELAVSFAEDFWPNVMDFFSTSTLKSPSRSSLLLSARVLYNY